MKPTVPDHTLLRAIGRGAYGEVWLARNVMGALRAVKVVWRRRFESDRPFEREFAGIQRFEPVSRSSGGLVHVLHVGRNDAEGYFYYVMELADAAESPVSSFEFRVPGAAQGSFAEPQPETPNAKPETRNLKLETYSPRTLRSDLKHLARLPTTDCLHLALDVVSGLAQLHRYGLVHRDVKPGNIIYVHGRAKLADIGLVSAGGEGQTFVGTEGYIPPEGPGSPAADLYALGIALYEASTGFSPERFPDVPAHWFMDPAGDAALELHEIILKACEGDRARRYHSAEAMQADLALLQSGQSVRRVRALERRIKWARRLGWAAALIAGLAVTTSLIANWRARTEAESHSKERQLRQQAQRERTRAETAELAARQQLNTALFEQARALVVSREVGHRTRALEALRKVAGTTNAAELRRIAFAALAQPDLRLRDEVRLPAKAHFLALDPFSERIVLGGGRGPVSLYSLPDGQPLATLTGSTNLPAYLARWSGDGRFVGVKRETVMGGREAVLEVWELGPTQRLALAGAKLSYGSFSFHPQQPLVMVGRVGGEVTSWNLETGREVRQFRLPGTLHALAYSPDGTRFAASYNAASQRPGQDWVVACHDTATLEAIGTLKCPEAVEEIAWHPGGRWISMAGLDDNDWQRNVRLIEVNTGNGSILGRHTLRVSAVKFTRDGNYLVTAGWDRDVACWDLRTLERAFTFIGVGFNMSWNAEGTRFVASPPGDSLQIYDFKSPVCRELTASPHDGIRAGVFSPDHRWLAAQEVRNVCVWDLSRDAPPAVLPEPREVTLLFSPDSTELIASRDRYLGRWRLNPSADASIPPRLEALPVQAPSGMRRAALAANELILTTTNGVHVTAWTNLDSGQGRFHRVRGGMGVASPEGQWLAMVYDYSSQVRVYRLPEMKEVARLVTSNFVIRASFAPAGDELTIVNRSGVECWNTRTWQLRRRLPVVPVAGAYVLYTPDEKGLWIVTHLRNTGLHDRDTLEPLLPLPAGTAPIAVSSDGRTLAASVDTRRVQLWDVPTLRQHFRELGLDW
jgi:WD40 repeat protein